jgi:hypothetical protein
VWPLLVAITLSVLAFVFALSVSSFLLRDVHFVDPPPRASLQDPPPPAVGPARPLGDAGLRSAMTAVAPLLPDCFAQARARDPSVPTAIVLRVELVASADSGEVRALRVVRGASPYLQHCFNERAIGARFPVDAPGEAIVRWRARVDEGRGVLEPAD